MSLVETFQNIFATPQEKFTNKLQNLKKQKELCDEAINNLRNQLKTLSQDWLNQEEIRYLEFQLKLQLELREVYKKYSLAKSWVYIETNRSVQKKLPKVLIPENSKKKHYQNQKKESFLWNILSIAEKQWWKNFNYLDFLNSFWLPWELTTIWFWLTENIWIKITPKNKHKIRHNLTWFIKFILKLESDWKNISNFNNSWAEWYFQFKNNNWWKKSSWKYNSFETWLRRLNYYYTWSFSISKKSPDWIQSSWKNSRKIDIKQLSAKQQTELFLADIFSRKDLKAHLENVLLNWNYWSMKKIYKIAHHTDVKWVTAVRLDWILTKLEKEQILRL